MIRATSILIALAALAPIPARAQGGTLSDPAPDRDPRGGGVQEEPEVYREPRFPGVAERPLTLPAGMARIEQVIFYHFFDFPLPLHGVPTGLSIGVTDDVEIGAVWGVTDDPSISVLARFVRDPRIDLGASARLTVPAMTTGDTLLTVSLPLAVRPLAQLRIDTGVSFELLFRAQVSPLLAVPLTITVAPHELFFFGAMGSAGWLDDPGQGHYAADAGGFIGWSGRNVHGVIADGRIAVQVFLPGNEIVISLGLRFYPRLWR